jgi:DNA (cytosine-5)-methyltransferase 1
MTIPASKSPAGVVAPELAVFDTQTETQKQTPSTPNVDPLDTLTETEELVLCLPEMWPVGLNVSYRMLKPKELKQAQGFPEEYTITGNKSEKCEQIGNAVPVNMAKELCKHALTSDSPSLSSFGGGVSGSSEADIPDYDEVSSVGD